MSQENKNFLYCQPKYKGRKRVRQLYSAIVIGATTLSLNFVYTQTSQGWERGSFIERRDAHGPREVIICATTVFVTSGATWQVPSDVNLLSQVNCIGAGGSGATSEGTTARNVTGGAGGGWSQIVNFSVTPGANISISIGAGGTGINQSTAGGTNGNPGGDTWFSSTATCLAKGGGGGLFAVVPSTAGPAVGGAAASGVGSTKHSGGNGGQCNSGSGSGVSGGGGAGGPNGDGVASPASSGPQTAGGNGDANSGGAGGGIGSGGTSPAGGAGAEYAATAGGTAGSGGGSGGNSSNATSAASGAAGLYGAGSGGAKGASIVCSSAAGAQGIIVIVYTPVPLAWMRRCQYLRR